MAKARVDFKQHLGAFVLVNLFLLGTWWFTGGRGWSGFWPGWVLLAWGLGLAFHGYEAYGEGGDRVAREEAKLRQKYER